MRIKLFKSCQHINQELTKFQKEKNTSIARLESISSGHRKRFQTKIDDTSVKLSQTMKEISKFDNKKY